MDHDAFIVKKTRKAANTGMKAIAVSGKSVSLNVSLSWRCPVHLRFQIGVMCVQTRTVCGSEQALQPDRIISSAVLLLRE